MLNVKKVVAAALSSVLTDADTGQSLSPTTVREIRLAYSLLTEGLPGADELRPFLGSGWVIRPQSRSTRRAGVNAITEIEFSLAEAQALAVRLGISERIVINLLRHPEPEASRSSRDRLEVRADCQFMESRRGRGASRSGTRRFDLMPAS
jgi:hypothetical protein